MPWVTLTRKASQGVWRMHQRNSPVRVAPEVANVEVLTYRNEASQAEEARRILRRLARKGFIPDERIQGAHYTIPLTLSRGCLECGERHIDKCIPKDIEEE